MKSAVVILVILAMAAVANATEVDTEVETEVDAERRHGKVRHSNNAQVHASSSAPITVLDYTAIEASELLY
jgi:hypothetical protein